jgi:hypothetical protein
MGLGHHLICRPQGDPMASAYVTGGGWSMDGVVLSATGLVVANEDIAVQEQVAGLFSKLHSGERR